MCPVRVEQAARIDAHACVVQPPRPLPPPLLLLLLLLLLLVHSQHSRTCTCTHLLSVCLHTYDAATPHTRRFSDAAAECTKALALAPASAKALQRRARSLEMQGLYKQALADIQAVNRSDAATTESRDAERRIKDALAGRRPAGLGAGLGPAAANGGGAAAAAAAAAAAQRRAQAAPVAAKATLDGDTRLVTVGPATSYALLLEQLRAAFPNAGPMAVSYTDAAGASVQIASKADVRAAVAAAAAAGRPLRLALTAGGAAPPAPPAEEVEELEAMRRRQEDLLRQIEAAHAEQRRKEQQAQAQAQQQPTVAVTPSGRTVAVDEWLIDFANVFRDVTGLDADRHIEAHNDGWDRTTAAMAPDVPRAAAAAEFDVASERFREVTCAGLLNWGHVSVCRARRAVDAAAAAGGALTDAAADEAAAHLSEAEARFREALRLHPLNFDALCALGALEFERAKLTARLAIAPVAPAAAAAAAAAAAQGNGSAAAAASPVQAALKEALGKLKAPAVEAARADLARASEWFAQAAAAGRDADAKRRAEDEEAAKAEGADAPPPEAADGAATFAAQALISEGNVLYEASQMLAAVGAADWRAVLDAATAKFREARCSEDDVRAALRNHTHAAELGLEEEDAKEAAAAAPAESSASSASAPKAKGLPSLDKGGKKGGGKKGGK